MVDRCREDEAIGSSRGGDESPHRRVRVPQWIVMIIGIRDRKREFVRVPYQRLITRFDNVRRSVARRGPSTAAGAHASDDYHDPQWPGVRDHWHLLVDSLLCSNLLRRNLLRRHSLRGNLVRPDAQAIGEREARLEAEIRASLASVEPPVGRRAILLLAGDSGAQRRER